MRRYSGISTGAFYNFVINFEAVLKRRRFVPTESKAISRRTSPPTGFAEITRPSLKALCEILSPGLRLQETGADATELPAAKEEPEKPLEDVFLRGLISSPDQDDDVLSRFCLLSAGEEPLLPKDEL